MSRASPPQRPPESTSWWAELLEALGFSGPGTWQTLVFIAVLLVVGFGPLLALAIFPVEGTARRVLVALGPVGVCLGLAALTLVCGVKYGNALGWSRRQITGLVGLFVTLGLLGGLGLWLSEA